MMIARSPIWIPTSLGAFLAMLLCEFRTTLIHGMGSNGHSKIPNIGVPEIFSSRKTVAPKNRVRAMLQDRLATHPRPWTWCPRCELQSYSKIQLADHEIRAMQGYYETYRIFTWILCGMELHGFCAGEVTWILCG